MLLKNYLISTFLAFYIIKDLKDKDYPFLYLNGTYFLKIPNIYIDFGTRFLSLCFLHLFFKGFIYIQSLIAS